ncbi:MAG: hypothetical protein LPJ91_06470 [Pseudazoarcus pumilus]|nr:hypothetical protein [Pseudazoarcus pumilus]
MASTWLPRAFFCLLLLLPSLAAANKGNIYCCQGANGQSICADVLPAACYGREYREISPRGTVLRVVAAPLTREERARLEAEKQREAELEAEREIQRRIDTALLETYRGLDDIDAREASSLADIDAIIADIRRRLKELDEEEVKLDQLIASIPPDQVTHRHRLARTDIDNERGIYQRMLQSKLKERLAVQERYAVDRRRYAELLAEKPKR